MFELRLPPPGAALPPGTQAVRRADLTTVSVGTGRGVTLNRWRNGDAITRLVARARDQVAEGLKGELVALEAALDASAEALKGGRNLEQTRHGVSAGELAADVAAAALGADVALVDGAALRPLGELERRHGFTVAELVALAPFADAPKDRTYPGGTAQIKMKSAAADLIVDDALRPATALAYAQTDADEVANHATAGPGLLLLEASGAQLLAALERSLSRYPAWSDDFPHFSAGLHVTFDPERHPGHRLLRGGVTLHGVDVDATRTYRVATTPRFARSAFLGDANPRGAPVVLVDAPDGPVLPALLRNLFVDVNALADAKLRRALALSRPALDRLSAAGGPLKRRATGFVLIPEKVGRISVI